MGRKRTKRSSAPPDDDDSDIEALLKEVLKEKKTSGIDMWEQMEKIEAIEKRIEATNDLLDEFASELCDEVLPSSTEVQQVTQPKFNYGYEIFFLNSAEMKLGASFTATPQQIANEIPFFIAPDNTIIATHVLHDLVASGFLHTFFWQKENIPNYICDWLFSLICFCPNEHIPGPAFRTLSSFISGVEMCVEMGTLTPNLDPSREPTSHTTKCKWVLTYDVFLQTLLTFGCDAQKLTETPYPKMTEETLIQRDKRSHTLTQTFPVYNFNLFIQTLGVCLQSQTQLYTSHNHLFHLIRICCQLLLDPLALTAKASLLNAILYLLHALPNFLPSDLKPLLTSLLQLPVTDQSHHWVKIALSLPITTKRAIVFKRCLAFSALKTIIGEPFPSLNFPNKPPINLIIKLIRTLFKKYFSSSTPLSFSLLSDAIELIDILIDKDITQLKTDVIYYQKLFSLLRNFYFKIPDNPNNTDISQVKEKLTRVFCDLDCMLTYVRSLTQVQTTVDQYFALQKETSSQPQTRSRSRSQSCSLSQETSLSQSDSQSESQSQSQSDLLSQSQSQSQS
jgi:hypothetical protein